MLSCRLDISFEELGLRSLIIRRHAIRPVKTSVQLALTKALVKKMGEVCLNPADKKPM